MKLFDYQQKIFDKVKDEEVVALFMEAGTGKTHLSLALHDYNKNEKLLILCLASKVDEWVEDCAMLDKRTIEALNKGKNKNKELLGIADINIISFQSALLIYKELLDIMDNRWTIIIDESQYIKTHNSKISKLCHDLGKRNKNKVILTGTPQNKGYIDYFSQLKFLGVFDKITDFKKKFCIEEQQVYGNVRFNKIVGYKNTAVLDKIIHRVGVFFKRDREIKDLPKERYVDFKKPSIYDKFKKVRVYEDVNCLNAGVLRIRLRQLCSGAIAQHRVEFVTKYDYLKHLIEYHDEKIVVFFNFNEECAMLREFLAPLGRPISIYKGDIKDTTAFKEEDDSILLVNYKSGGTGINWLKDASICVFFSPPESYLEFEQARKRLDRIGQKKIPYFYKFRTKGSVEKAIYSSIERKEDFDDAKFKEYLGGDENGVQS